MLKDAGKAWVVTTKHAGERRPLHVCEFEATARRMAALVASVSEPRIEACPIYNDGECTYGPVFLMAPTGADREKQARISARNKAERKARSLGLTEQEIEALSIPTD